MKTLKIKFIPFLLMFALTITGCGGPTPSDSTSIESDASISESEASEESITSEESESASEKHMKYMNVIIENLFNILQKKKVKAKNPLLKKKVKTKNLSLLVILVRAKTYHL